MRNVHSTPNERWSDVRGVNFELAKADIGIAEHSISRGRHGEGEAVCKRNGETYEKECGTNHQGALDIVYALAQACRNQPIQAVRCIFHLPLEIVQRVKTPTPTLFYLHNLLKTHYTGILRA
jgi:hypothetical protein